MKRQHQAVQIGAISPDNPGIKCRDDPFALRCFPTLPPIERHLRAQAQILNHDVFVALVARAGRRLRGHDDRRPIVSLSSWLPRRRLDFSPSPLSPPPDPPWSVALSMPEGFCGGRGGRFFNRASSSLTA